MKAFSRNLLLGIYIFVVILVSSWIYYASLPGVSGNGSYTIPLNILNITNDDFSVSFDINKWHFTADGNERCWSNEAGGWCSESKTKRVTMMGTMSYEGSFTIKEHGKVYAAKAYITSVLGDKNLLPTIKCLSKELVALCESFQSSIKFYYVSDAALLWVYPGVEVGGPDFDPEEKPYMELAGVEWQSGTMNFISPLGCTEFNLQAEKESINKCLQKRLDDDLRWPTGPESFRTMQDVRLKYIVQHRDYKLVDASGIIGVMPWFYPVTEDLWIYSLFRS